MPARKRSNVPSMAPAASSVDTSRWENLLSAGSRKHEDAAPVTAVRLGHRISIAAPHAAGTSSLATRNGSTPALSSNSLTPASDRLPTKKSKQGSSSRGGAPLKKNAWPTNNWQTLLGGGNAAVTATAAAGAAATTAPAGAAAGAPTATNNGRLEPNAKKRKKKNKEKNKGKNRLPEFENGTAIRGEAAPSPPDFFAASPRPNPGAASSNPASNPRTGDLLSVSNGGGKAGKKRKRKGANSAADSTAPAPPNVRTGGHFHKQKSPSAEVPSGNKWPRSNVLNLAFQATKDKAGGADQEGTKKRRGKEGGGGGKGSNKGSQQALTAAEEAQYLGLDCEMVGVGPAGRRSALARCCIVGWNGNVM